MENRDKLISRMVTLKMPLTLLVPIINQTKVGMKKRMMRTAQGKNKAVTHGIIPIGSKE